MEAVHNACTIYSHANELLTLIWDFHKSECVDPRDRIFALQSLAEDVVPGVGPEILMQLDKSLEMKTSILMLPVDYTSPWIETYRRLALECTVNGKDQILLEHLFAFGTLWEQQQNPKIPSWIPAWNTVRDIPELHGDMMESDKKLLLKGFGFAKEVISIANEWPPAPEMYISHILDLFNSVVAEGLVSFSEDNQKARDILKQRAFWKPSSAYSWRGVLAEIEARSPKQHEAARESFLEIMKVYSLIKLEGNSTAIGRGRIQIGDALIYTDTGFFAGENGWEQKPTPTICVRLIPQSLVLSDGANGTRSEGAWKIVGPAFVLYRPDDHAFARPFRGTII